MRVYAGEEPVMRRLAIASTAEFIGTALLVCVVVGSGIMGANLSSDAGIALIINAVSTILALALLILILSPLSGAHLNPAVSLVQLAARNQPLRDSLAFITAQIAGAVAGAILANMMFELPAVTLSGNDRAGVGTLIGEVIATAGLIAVIGILVARNLSALMPMAVAAWIGSACFFTSSASFANPAVTIGRMFSDTFAGIEPASVLPYIAAQLVGAGLGVVIVTAYLRALTSVQKEE